MSAYDETEDTRDEAERFADAYTALGDDTEQEETPAAAADQTEEDGDEDELEAADPGDDEDDDEATPPPTTPEPPASLAETKRQLNQAHAEIGRLRPLREALPRVQAQAATYEAQVRALSALLDQRDQELLTTWQQAAQQTEDPVQRNYYAAEAARRQTQFQADRERMGWEAQRTAQTVQQQVAQQTQYADLDAFVRQGAEEELRAIIAREARAQGLSKEDRAALRGRIQTREFQYLVQNAPGPQAAQVIAAKAQELVDAARALGKQRAGSNRERAAQQGTYRAEKPVKGAPAGRPSEREIARKYRNSGDMAGMYRELFPE